MNRVDAIKKIIRRHSTNAAIVFANGLTSREASFAARRTGNFYLLHGMGEALSVGVGLKMARPDLEVVIVDGDGNASMGLASWCLLPIKGLHYYVLCNHVYETTGAQRCPPQPFNCACVHRIFIEPGAVKSPNPPAPEKIKQDFMRFLRKEV